MVKMARTYARNAIAAAIAVPVAWLLPPYHIPFICGVIVLAGLYYWSLRRRPTRPCWTCNGTGGFRDPVWRRAQGLCPSCGGQKGHRRWGVTLLYGKRQVPNEARATAAKQRRAAPR